MTNLIATQFATDNIVNIRECYNKLNVSKLQARVFNDFYAIRTVALCEDKGLEELLCESIQATLAGKVNPQQIDYVIFAHTSLTNAPFAYGLLNRVVTQCGLTNATYFGVNLNNCASTVEAFSIVSTLFSANSQAKYSVVISGDRIFTKQHRLLHNASIAGDAAGAALFAQTTQFHHGLRLLCTQKCLFPQFYKGAWLSGQQAQALEAIFPELMAQAIILCSQKAGIPLEKIKYILPHNVNLPVWQQISNLLGCEFNNIFTKNIGRYGHCFSTDTLINLTDVFNEIDVNEYILVATVGFGLCFVVAAFQKVTGKMANE